MWLIFHGFCFFGFTLGGIWYRYVMYKITCGIHYSGFNKKQNNPMKKLVCFRVCVLWGVGVCARTFAKMDILFPGIALDYLLWARQSTFLLASHSVLLQCVLSCVYWPCVQLRSSRCVRVRAWLVRVHPIPLVINNRSSRSRLTITNAAR